jgi:hypothetical protein
LLSLSLLAAVALSLRWILLALLAACVLCHSVSVFRFWVL